MRVLQLIDSLDAGGAERVAVNIANVLASKIETSFLCTTRKEGLLKNSLSSNVEYLFLNKKGIIDLKAIKKLNTFVKQKKIQIIHAHSSSFFLATIIKLLNRNISIIWHDHYGNSEFLKNRKFGFLKFCSKYFSHVFSVNKTLEAWSKEKLEIKNVSYLPNFAVINKTSVATTLKGESGKRIICLANLRPQKDHITLLEAFNEVLKNYSDWTLHCVGKNFNDDYFEAIRTKTEELNLIDSVFIYGSKPDIFNILKQCDIGVLSSKSEGLPIALLEYGLAKLPVIATKVGECETVITNNYDGVLVNATKREDLSKALSSLVENKELRETYAKRYEKNIQENYSDKIQLQTILVIYRNFIK
ncbi:glycosyltransferase [Flavivirga spongiicola]|uniref:Glycosyltransferase n=1 Tax=Flavivirga spongiicola TaxID=421621 RepID=A0ABU7XNA1_9FLAO|nr:glycosyltransferase [Flavivirga sp. MEBiC05379]MDO5981680.1 glycosyltransferase [Flavivirga sp. MEBiC05379]